MFWPAYGIQGCVLDSAFGLLALSFLRGFDFGPDTEEAFVRSGFAEFEGWVLQERHCLASAARRAAKRRAERRGGQARTYPVLLRKCINGSNRRGFIRLGRVEEDLRGEKVVTQLAGSAGVIQRVHSHAVTGREVAQRPSGSAYAGRRGTDGGLRWGCDSKAGDNASGGMHVLVSEACDINKRKSRERAVMKSRESGVMSEIRDPYARLSGSTLPYTNRTLSSLVLLQLRPFGMDGRLLVVFIFVRMCIVVALRSPAWLCKDKHHSAAARRHRAAIKNLGPDRNITRRVHAKPSKVHVNQNFFYS
ncbi:hypothetical protein GGX14DRAFT_393091 [Mycena pura]|uniref:Uncharacterized protein n=1 Tax=Mycena pura TaxID=153505 RepID=A0AAD6VID0_9AGAR|nr:hypothetical protein GGX14DRAFT_393091 [Mycena pura]